MFLNKYKLYNNQTSISINFQLLSCIHISSFDLRLLSTSFDIFKLFWLTNDFIDIF